jgi:hypothetical protein
MVLVNKQFLIKNWAKLKYRRSETAEPKLVKPFPTQL